MCVSRSLSLYSALNPALFFVLGFYSASPTLCLSFPLSLTHSMSILFLKYIPNSLLVVPFAFFYVPYKKRQWTHRESGGTNLSSNNSLSIVSPFFLSYVLFINVQHLVSMCFTVWSTHRVCTLTLGWIEHLRADLNLNLETVLSTL